MIVCRKCQASNVDRSLYCTQCGESLSILTEDEKITEQLKERSRQLARERQQRRHHSALDDELTNLGRPYKKNYVAITIISAILFVVGFVLCAGGMFGLGAAIISPVDAEINADMQSNVHGEIDIPNAMTITSKLTTAIASIAALYTGIMSIAAAEVFKLFMDLQENADRQSMLLTLLWKKAIREE